MTAAEEIVRQRVKERFAKTGRNIPESALVASLRSVSDSIHKLTPLCDFVAKIDNNGSQPELVAYSVVDSSKDWGLIARQFAKPPHAHFPASMAPLALVELGTLSDVVRHESSRGARKTLPESALFLTNSHPALAAVAAGLVGGRGGTTPLVCSQAHLVTLSKDARAEAGIPCKADTFAFAYPCHGLDSSKVRDFSYTEEDRACLLPLAGGFVYFDADGEVCGVNAILGQSHDLYGADHYESEKYKSVRKKAHLLQFALPAPLPAATARALMAPGARRMQPVTLEALSDRGALEFAWICPGEKLDGMKGGVPGGAFAYLMKEGCENVYFPVAS